jgi:hypothetical protein
MPWQSTKTIYPGDSTLDFYCYCLKRGPSLLRFLPALGPAFARFSSKQNDHQLGC